MSEISLAAGFFLFSIKLPVILRKMLLSDINGFEFISRIIGSQQYQCNVCNYETPAADRCDACALWRSGNDAAIIRLILRTQSDDAGTAQVANLKALVIRRFASETETEPEPFDVYWYALMFACTHNMHEQITAQYCHIPADFLGSLREICVRCDAWECWMGLQNHHG